MARQKALAELDAKSAAGAPQRAGLAYLAGTASNPIGGLERYSAQKAQDALAERNRLLHGQEGERLWEGKKFEISKAIHMEAESQFKIAGERQISGYNILTNMDAQDRETMTANTRAILDTNIANMKSEDAHLQRTMLAAIQTANAGMKGAIANQVQGTKETRMKLDAAMKKMDNNRLTIDGGRKALGDAQDDMAKHVTAISELFLEQEENLTMRVADKEDPKVTAQLQALQERKKQLILLVIGPIANNVKKLEGWLRVQMTTVTPGP